MVDKETIISEIHFCLDFDVKQIVYSGIIDVLMKI